MKWVLKLTGKIFDERNVDKLPSIADIILRRVSLGDKVAVVVGGGETARKYIRVGGSLGLSKSHLDMLGIKVTRVNAYLLTSLLGEVAYPEIPVSADEVLRALNLSKVTVVGGLQPGQSTNAVAAFIAESMRAELLINATNVDGVYDKDPCKYPDAVLYRELTIGKLEEIIKSQNFTPGGYELLDPVALNIVKRSRITLVFVNAFKPHMIEEVLEGSRDTGTWVIPE